jgi:hypothetical protein
MHADNILVVEAGQVVESGRHEKLLRKGGRYASFHRLQLKEQSPTLDSHATGSCYARHNDEFYQCAANASARQQVELGQQNGCGPGITTDDQLDQSTLGADNLCAIRP